MTDTSTEYLLRLVEPPISLALKELPFRRTLPCHLLFGPLKRQVERDGEYYEGPKPQEISGAEKETNQRMELRVMSASTSSALEASSLRPMGARSTTGHTEDPRTDLDSAS